MSNSNPRDCGLLRDARSERLGGFLFFGAEGLSLTKVFRLVSGSPKMTRGRGG
jgi:hypothetical protein